MDKLKVAVIGVGHLGQHHARNYSESEKCELVGVVDTNKKTADKIARLYKTKPYYDYTDIIGKIEAASIVVPTALHHEIASELLKKGIDVLVEKPITTTLEQADELVKLAREKNRILQVGHIERFSAPILKLKSMLKIPVFVEVHRLGPYDPRVKDIGVVLDLMIHDIDIILQIVNSPIKSIDAVGVGIYSEKEDIANCRFKFENGCTANVTASRITPDKKRKIRIFQEDAYISIDYANQAMDFYETKEISRPKKGQPGIEISRRKIRLKKSEPLKLELEDFLDCVRKGRSPTVTGEQAKNALEIAITISNQIKDNLRVIQENLDHSG